MSKAYRILSILLAAMLCLSLLPAGALADGEPAAALSEAAAPETESVEAEVAAPAEEPAGEETDAEEQAEDETVPSPDEEGEEPAEEPEAIPAEEPAEEPEAIPAEDGSLINKQFSTLAELKKMMKVSLENLPVDTTATYTGSGSFLITESIKVPTWMTVNFSGQKVIVSNNAVLTVEGKLCDADLNVKSGRLVCGDRAACSLIGVTAPQNIQVADNARKTVCVYKNCSTPEELRAVISTAAGAADLPVYYYACIDGDIAVDSVAVTKKLFIAVGLHYAGVSGFTASAHTLHADRVEVAGNERLAETIGDVLKSAFDGNGSIDESVDCGLAVVGGTLSVRDLIVARRGVMGVVAGNVNISGLAANKGYIISTEKSLDMGFVGAVSLKDLDISDEPGRVTLGSSASYCGGGYLIKIVKDDSEDIFSGFDLKGQFTKDVKDYGGILTVVTYSNPPELLAVSILRYLVGRKDAAESWADFNGDTFGNAADAAYELGLAKK